MKGYRVLVSLKDGSGTIFAGNITTGKRDESATDIAILISAAPELLDALKELTAHIDGSGFADRLPMYKRAKAAIDKAEGKTQ